AHLLEPPELGDVVQDHDDADLALAQAERHRVHLNAPLDRAGEPELAIRDAALAGGAALAERLVQLRVADDLEEGFALAARRVEPEHGSRPLVQEKNDVAPVDGDDALDHPVEDRGRLRLLVAEIVDLLAPLGRGP